MTADPEARKLSINYTGGSVYMTIGALKSLLGSNYDQLVSTPKDTDVAVKSHPRTRVIGGPSITVAQHNYTYKQWPTSESGSADGGSIVFVSWAGSDGWWSARVNGSFADFGTFLQDNAQGPSFFTSLRGTKYGPY